MISGLTGGLDRFRGLPPTAVRCVAEVERGGGQGPPAITQSTADKAESRSAGLAQRLSQAVACASVSLADRPGLSVHGAPGFSPQTATAAMVSTNSTNVRMCTLVQYRQMLPMMKSSA